MKFIQSFKNRSYFYIIALSFMFLGLNSMFAQSRKSFLVVLDAGHGGKDPGKIGHAGAKEKDVALSIVLKTGALLEQMPGIKVIYTRKTDVFVDLWERGRIANKADADLFVSIHCNAHNSTAIGAETWVLGVHANERNFNVAKAENEVILLEENHQQKYNGFDPKSPTSLIGLSLEQEENLDMSLRLASFVQHEFESSLNKINRGVKQAGFVVLHQTYMPSVLIETGFLTHPEEGVYLNSDEGQNEMAKSISKSIRKFYEQQVLNSTNNDVPVKTKDSVVVKEVAAIISPATAQSKEVPSTEISQKDLPVFTNTGEEKFTILLASGKRKLATEPYNFKGLKGVKMQQKGVVYQYLYGGFSTEASATVALKEVQQKGFTTAYVLELPNKGVKNNQKQDSFQNTAIVLEKAVSKELVFKVQLAISTKNIPTAPYNFNGLENVTVEKIGNQYKYFYGTTSNYQEAEKNLKEAKEKKYPTAFIMATYRGKVISVKEALRLSSLKQ